MDKMSPSICESANAEGSMIAIFCSTTARGTSFSPIKIPLIVPFLIIDKNKFANLCFFEIDIESAVISSMLLDIFDMT